MLCWLKPVWEKADAFNLTIYFNDNVVEPPREGDQWFMRAVEAAGFAGNKLLAINRVRCRQQVLFLSYVLCAGSRYLDEKYKEFRDPDDRWSVYTFPNEDLSQADLTVWKEALGQIAPGGQTRQRVRNFVSTGPKLWMWICNEGHQRIHEK